MNAQNRTQYYRTETAMFAGSAGRNGDELVEFQDVESDGNVRKFSSKKFGQLHKFEAFAALWRAFRSTEFDRWKLS